MAALFAVLSALVRSTWRSLRGVGSITGNNLFAFIALLMANEPVDRPSSTAVFYMFIGLLYTVPLALELERRIPKARLELWPLSGLQRIVLTLVNLLLNPVLFLALLFAMLSRHPAVGGALLCAGLLTPPVVLAAEAIGRWVPRLPALPRIPLLPGRLSGLVLNHLREFLQSLDVYLAALLSAGGIAYRMLAATPDPVAPVVMGGLVVLFMSTLAQVGGGFDPDAMLTRQRLLPVSGFDLLLARDVAWMLIVVVLVAAYPLLPSLSAAFAALAAGHSTVVRTPLEQKRGHFAAGRLAPNGLYQCAAIIAAGAAASQWGWPVLIAALGVWWLSAWHYGRRISTAA